ncbi:hypothetical protein EB796_008803 [Bugula neritina]|uniref:Uncharacterized protein n=1 Tax=Bugula neritina TaxID=10212 RepID=A0A7J7K3U7_BUGNE|nr:hypothetical protein EB796_008803 [Bugula neritina]
MSLWSGAVTLHQLDLRLDAIEESINLPVKLSNGHIRELKIQVTSVYFNQSVPVMFNKLIGYLGLNLVLSPCLLKLTP